MIKQIPIVIAVVLVLAGALVQGYYSERWTTFPELEQYAERLKNVPMDIADWRGEDGAALDERTKQVAGVVGSINRTYTSATLNESVMLNLVCGRRDDMIKHTPERCYPAAGWEKEGKQAKADFSEGVGGDFFTNTYTKNEPTGTQKLRVYWSWSSDGDWLAPEEFKWTFGGVPSVYKLYVMLPVTATNHGSENKDNAAGEFLRVALPELRKALFDKAPAAGKAAASKPAESKPADSDAPSEKP